MIKAKYKFLCYKSVQAFIVGVVMVLMIILGMMLGELLSDLCSSNNMTMIEFTKSSVFELPNCNIMR